MKNYELIRKQNIQYQLLILDYVLYEWVCLILRHIRLKVWHYFNWFIYLDKDPKCRYRVHFPEAPWHTAYDVCSRDNMTLAKASTPIEIHLIDIVLYEVLPIL